MATVEIEGVSITHPERVLYPESGLTKLDLIRYYQKVADRMLPHVANRPLSLFRCPEGLGKPCFFQKHAERGLPGVVDSVEIREERGTRRRYAVVRDLAGIVGLVQMNVLEIHLWGSRDDDVERPDWIVFDLDPDAGLAFGRVLDAARELHEKLELLGLRCWIKTTGGKGLHVVVPLARRHGWDVVGGFARAIAGTMESEAPDRYTINPLKARRKGRIFIDYLRNARGSTAIAPYSARARAGATVATPIGWPEVSARLDPAKLTIATVQSRLRRLARDPWAGLRTSRQQIPESVLRDAGA